MVNSFRPKATMVILKVSTMVSLMLITMAAMCPRARADPRAQTVNITCGTQLEHNTTIFVPNFVAVMENISDQMRSTGFGSSVVGTGPDTNYGLAQCYGDLSLLDCVLCYAEARTVLPQCFPFNSGRIFLDGCFMRAENYSFFNEYTGPDDRAVCNGTRMRGAGFGEAVRRGLEEAVETALAPIVPGYHYGKARVVGGASNSNNSSSNSSSSSSSAYVLVECWRSLNESSCRKCFESGSESLLGCLPLSEGRALNTGCFMRYSDYDFLNRNIRARTSRGTRVVIIVSVVSSVIVLVVGLAIGHQIWKNRYIQKKRRGSDESKKMVKTLNDSSLNFKYSALEKATGSFHESNKLGQGGFGSVYKGVLPDGREIAVKRLFFNNKHRATDFFNEVNIISTVEHKNLVRLLGCSCSGPESLLVYEYLPNKSLDRFIFDKTRGKGLSWEKRNEIIIGTAEGLVYLHENSNIRIIHRDIKSSNILLDSRLRAKIADFGLARSFQEDKSHISTAIAGTLGYMAPEYLAHGQLTEKVDVYSFGVLLLEIVTGRSNNRSKTSEYSDSLVTLAWKHFQLGTIEELYDLNLMLHNYIEHQVQVKNQIYRVVHIGLLCTQEIASLRPTMSKTLQMLTNKEENLQAPTSPPFVDEKTMELNDTCEDPSRALNGDAGSVADISHSSFYPR